MFLPGSSDGLTNNTTAVTVVASPAASTQRMVRMVTVYNADTVSASGYLKLISGANIRILFKFTLSAGDTFKFGDLGDLIVLDATNKSLKVVLTGSVTTNQLDWTSHWGDNS